MFRIKITKVGNKQVHTFIISIAIKSLIVSEEELVELVEAVTVFAKAEEYPLDWFEAAYVCHKLAEYKDRG